jgi:hypothetical protein
MMNPSGMNAVRGNCIGGPNSAGARKSVRSRPSANKRALLRYPEESEPPATVEA